jgi:Flp pilus assembly protein TadD
MLWAAAAFDYGEIERAIRERRFSWAEQQLERRIAAEPTDFRARTLMGMLCGQQNQHAKAVLHFQEAARLRPREISAWLNVMQAQLALGEFAGARESAGRASRLDPGSADLHNRLGAVQAAFGDYAGAIVNFVKANSLQPGSYDARFNLALAYHRNGDPDGALKILEPMSRQRDIAEIQNLLGEVYEKKGRYLDAVRAFQRGAELEPTNED